MVIKINWTRNTPTGFLVPEWEEKWPLGCFYHYEIIIEENPGADSRKLFTSLSDFDSKAVLAFETVGGCIDVIESIETEKNFEAIVNNKEWGIDPQHLKDPRVLCILGIFRNTSIWVAQILSLPTYTGISNSIVEEYIIVGNWGSTTAKIHDLKMGFSIPLKETDADIRLVAIPFKIQVDGKEHDYSSHQLITRQFSNSDASILELGWSQTPDLIDLEKLRSEAWALTVSPSQTLLIAKYAQEHIEHAICSVEPGEKNTEECPRLIFGGVGLSLYSEPQEGTTLPPRGQFRFGMTRYHFLEGNWKTAYYVYRNFLAERGHAFPPSYAPPLNWNEIYDVGWYHSDYEALEEFYTRDALLEEARKAREIGAELLYLDPGWEVVEGTTVWDENRLGAVEEFLQEIKDKYGLDVGFRTIGRVYRDLFPKEWLVEHRDLEKWSPSPPARARFSVKTCLEPCSLVPAWQDLKRERIPKIINAGMKFIMFDEYDWRGPCFNPIHEHKAPTTPLQHAMVVFSLCRYVKERFPDLLIETHDPVWPWQSRYLPTYFQQGFDGGTFHENWGFEFMWNPIPDLSSGKASSLYYYALGCPIPLYLHIPMAPDNDNLLFFWWAASTVRHLGIGGKEGSDTVTPPQILDNHKPEERWATYSEQVKKYLEFRPYFTHGIFYGISKECHLHVLPGVAGGIVNLFNLSPIETERIFRIPLNFLDQTNEDISEDTGGVINISFDDETVIIKAKLNPFSHQLIRI